MEKSKKLLITKIVISVVAVILAIVCLVIIGTKAVSKYDGKFTIEVVNLENEKVLDRKVKFKKDQTILEVLNNYEIAYTMGTGAEDGMVITIAGVKQDSKNSDYIMIYIDGEYATVGIKQIEPKDGMVLSFKVEHFEPTV